MLPDLSLVVLAHDNLELTERCVASLRAGTAASYELIVVDNGSAAEAAAFAREAADVPVLLDRNRGFAPGMNAGLAAASGRVVAFINNDTVFPPGWDTPLLPHLDDPSIGIVAPAVTAAGNPVTVRATPGDEVVRLLPFGEFPSGVVYLARRSTITELGGWNEDYPVASAEDLDLCFTVWANGLDILLDTRALVDHVGQASVRQLEDRRALYASNLEMFLTRWGSTTPEIPRLASVAPDELARNAARARTAIRWIRRMLDARDQARGRAAEVAALERRVADLEARVDRRQASPTGTGTWSRRLRRLLGR